MFTVVDFSTGLIISMNYHRNQQAKTGFLKQKYFWT